MSEKTKILDEALKNIEKQFGKGSIMKMWDSTVDLNVKTVHSGSYSLDLILWWGYPEWRIVEIYGPESSGKTTIALHAIAEVQKKWELAAFIDAEHAMDPIYAANLWVDVDNLLLSQPDYGEQALQITEELAKSGAVKLIVIDSVAALTPRAEVEWDMWDSFMGLQARMMSQWLRKLTSITAKTGTTIMFLNQMRLKIWIMFGNPETTTWGNALKFYASQRLDIRRWEKIEEDKKQIGYVAKIKNVKNKVAPPFQITTVPVIFNKGFDKEADLIEACLQLEIISRSGAFYSIWDQKIQWKKKVWELLKSNTVLRWELEKMVVDAIKNKRNKPKKKEDKAENTGDEKEKKESTK